MKPWIEAMRLRTLPVSMAGVLGGTACAAYHHGFAWAPMVICLIFAIIAQIASNFANEYYDYKNGLDKKGREGFRRGVTEGDISPQAMKITTYTLLAIDALLGCTLIIWGGWWLIPVGIAIVIFAVAYSTGPYPLSHHGLGDITVIIFFGFVPVIFTEYVQTQIFNVDYVTFCVALAIGVMAANVLIVNNYRDYKDDKEVGKHTTVVIFGPKTMANVYLLNGIVAAICLGIATTTIPLWAAQGWLPYLIAHLCFATGMKRRSGAELNSLLKYTSILLFLVSIYLLVVLAVYPFNPDMPY